MSLKLEPIREQMEKFIREGNSIETAWVRASACSYSIALGMISKGFAFPRTLAESVLQEAVANMPESLKSGS